MSGFLRKIFESPYFIFLEIILIGALISINLTSVNSALQADAGEYLRLAVIMASHKLDLLNIIFQKSFMDIGYTFTLSVLLRVFGNHLIIFQSFNFIFWLSAVVLIYKTLKILTDEKKAFWGSFVMALSPTFLTFSARLYSEPLAALGCAMTVYFLVKYKSSGKYLDLISIFCGMIIFFFTKTVYTLMFIPVVFLVFTKKNKRELLIIFIGVILILTRLFSSLYGGRSDFNLAIQTSKLFQSYNTIEACSIYYLSYPLGKSLLPEFEGACHQNNPNPKMPRYNENPYLLASSLRGNFGFQKWLQIIFSQPIKYFVVTLSSMTTIILVEGIWIDIFVNTSSILAVILTGIVKLLFAFYIWVNVIKNFYVFSKRSFWFSLVSVAPLIYFFTIIGNYPVEQRYFYPLLPWAYFYAALDKKGILRLKKIFKS